MSHSMLGCLFLLFLNERQKEIIPDTVIPRKGNDFRGPQMLFGSLTNCPPGGAATCHAGGSKGDLFQRTWSKKEGQDVHYAVTLGVTVSVQQPLELRILSSMPRVRHGKEASEELLKWLLVVTLDHFKEVGELLPSKWCHVVPCSAPCHSVRGRSIKRQLTAIYSFVQLPSMLPPSGITSH
jgi:hypothetical protein